MPDPIKDLYNTVKSNGIFVDESDFRSQLTKAPKDVYSSVSDLFVDYNDFENVLGFKKKVGGAKLDQSGPTLDQDLPSQSVSIIQEIDPEEIKKRYENVNKGTSFLNNIIDQRKSVDPSFAKSASGVLQAAASLNSKGLKKDRASLLYDFFSKNSDIETNDNTRDSFISSQYSGAYFSESPDLINEYNNSELKQYLSPRQYTGLKSLSFGRQSKYADAANKLKDPGLSDSEKAVLKLDLDKIGINIDKDASASMFNENNVEAAQRIYSKAKDDELIVDEAYRKIDYDNPYTLRSFGNIIKGAVNRGLAVGGTADIITATSNESGIDVDKLAKLQGDMQDAKSSLAYEQFSNDPSIENFKKNPIGIMLELGLESLTSLYSHGSTRMATGAATGAGLGSVIPGIGTAAGASTGAIAGLGMASLNLEYSSKILEGLSNLGVNTTSPDELKKAFADQDVMDKLKQDGLKKGIPVALFDMLSAGIAGKIISKPARTIIGKVAQGIAETGVQAGLGAAGEASGQLVSEGKISSPNAVLMEAIGEFGPGTVEIAYGNIVESAKRNKPINKADVVSVASSTRQDIINSNIDAQIASGNISAAQADVIKKQISETQSVLNKVPQDLTTTAKANLLDLVDQKLKLVEQSKTLDDAFKPEVEQKIKSIDQQILDITKSDRDATSQIQEAETESSISQPQLTPQGQPEISQGQGIQVQVSQPQLDPLGADSEIKRNASSVISDELIQELGDVDSELSFAIGKASKSLEKTGVKFEVIDSSVEGDSQMSARGDQAIFISDEGRVVIDKSKLKNDVQAGLVVWHEASHPVMNIIRNTNKSLYDTVVRGMNESVKSNDEVLGALDWAKENYSKEKLSERYGREVSDEEAIATQSDEAIVETIGRINSGIIDIVKLDTGFKQKLIDFVNNIAKVFNINPILNDTDLAAFKKTVSEVSDALKTGRDISEVVGAKNVNEFINNAESPEFVIGGNYSIQARVDDSPISIYESKEISTLPTLSLSEIHKKFDGKAVIINSDPTRVGELILPSGKKIFMYGGPAYLSVKENVDGNVGFATTQLSKVNSWVKYVNQLFGNNLGVTLVATQAPTSMLSNSYALRYVMDGISMLPKSVLKSSSFKDEFFGKDLVLLKDAFGEKGYVDFVNKYKKADLSSPAVIDGMISEMAYKIGDDNKPASFKARGAFVSNLLGGLALKSSLKGVEGDIGYVSKKPSKYISSQLFERLGINTEKVIREIGEPSLVNLYMDKGTWGIAVSGFETDPSINVASVQSGGVKHPLFNAKFPGKNPFILDGAYEVNKMFKPVEMTGPSGKPYTKTAAQMLAGSMYVKGQPTQTDASFEYNTTLPAASRIQASVGNRPEQSKDFKVAAFIMRKLGEGADKIDIAQGVASATGMSLEDVNKIIENPQQYIRDSFPQLSNLAQDNLIERANIQNIYRGHNSQVNPAFTGMEVPRSKVIEYLSKSNNRDKSFAESLRGLKNKYLDPARGLPDWVMAIKDFASGSKNIEIARAVKSIERLKAEAKKIGFKDWDAFSKAMVAVRDIKRYIPDEDGVTLFDPYRASEGKSFTTPDNMLPAIIPDELKALPESIRPFAVQMRQQIDGITKDLIGSGYVTPEQAVTLEKNLGQYVNRSYKIFNERGFKPNPNQVVDAINFIANQKLSSILNELFPAEKKSKSKAVSDFKGNIIDPNNVNMDELYKQAVEEAKKDVEAILDKKRNPYFNTSTDSRDTGILKQKKDIPEPLRKLMGEYTDPGTVFVMTVAKQAALKAQSEYLTKLRELGMGSMFFEKYDKNRPAEFSVQIASFGTESKSPLGGLYTTKAIAEALEMAEPTYNELTQVWMKMVGAVRWGKTVGSVATQFKNFLSNIGFGVLNGMFLTGENTQSLKAAAQYVKGQYSKEEMDQITEKVIKLNLVGQSVGAREISEMLGSGDIHDIALDIAANPNNKWGKRTKTVIKPFSAANKLYRMGDDFWKVYAYINEREMVSRGRFKTNYESLTLEQQEKVDIESSERVKNTWPTYDRVVEGAKYVSKRAPIVGNFISFQAESLRVLVNSIKMARQDMKDPEMREAGIKRMVGIMTYGILRAGITSTVASAAGMAASGILGAAMGDDDEEQKKRAFKKAMPIYTRTSDIAVIPTNDPHKFTAFSLSSLDPYGIIPSSLNALTEGREGIFSDEMEPGVAAAIAEFFSGFLEPEMTFSTMYAVKSNVNPKTGRPIFLKGDSASEIAVKVGAFILGQLEPSTLSLIQRGMERGWGPEVYSFAGARPIDVDFHKSFGYILSDMSKQMDAIGSEYGTIKISDKYTEQEKADAELEAERKKAFLITNISQTYRDFIKAGASPSVLDEMISNRSPIKVTGFDKTTKKAIKTGEVKSEKLFK